MVSVVGTRQGADADRIETARSLDGIGLDELSVRCADDVASGEEMNPARDVAEKYRRETPRFPTPDKSFSRWATAGLIATRKERLPKRSRINRRMDNHWCDSTTTPRTRAATTTKCSPRRATCDRSTGPWSTGWPSSLLRSFKHASARSISCFVTRVSHSRSTRTTPASKRCSRSTRFPGSSRPTSGSASNEGSSSAPRR